MASVNIEKNTGPIKILQRLRANPTFLGDVVNSIAKVPFIDPEQTQVTPLPFQIEEKIEYNSLVGYRYLVETYSVYHNHLEEIYTIVERTMPAVRFKINRRINFEYRRIKGELIKQANKDENTIDIIRQSSDSIIDQVKDYLKGLLYESSNLDENICVEDIDTAIEIVIGDCFVNCKILENPNSEIL